MEQVLRGRERKNCKDRGRQEKWINDEERQGGRGDRDHVTRSMHPLNIELLNIEGAERCMTECSMTKSNLKYIEFTEH
jgi:hypothetical protein